MTRFSIIGAGWRTEFFLRIARELPGQFEILRVLARRPERADEIERTWHVKTCQTVEEILKDKPEFVVTSVSWDANPVFMRQLAEAGMPVLSETPPARSVDDMIALMDLMKAGAKVQVAEQYFLQPEHAARIAIVNDGKLGDVFQAQVSVCHGYHGISLIRKLLGVGYESPTIVARNTQEHVIGGPDRIGRPPTEEKLEHQSQLIAQLDFGDKLGIFDFVGSMYRSWIRSHRVLVRGEKGEINFDRVRYLKDFRTPIDTQLKRVDAGHTGNLEGFFHQGIQAGEEWVYRNPFPFARLMDDEIAIATCFVKMAEYAQGAPGFYPLAEACQDHYLSILMNEAAERGQAVQAEVQPWSEFAQE